MLDVQVSSFIRSKEEGTKGDDACGHLITEDDILIGILCDGVGSALKGGQAARESVNFFLTQFKNRPKSWDIPKSLTILTEHLNRNLFKESMTQYDSIEFLTTLNLFILDQNKLYTLNLGDSKTYLIRKDKDIIQLSTDHNMDDDANSHVLTKACGLSENIEFEIQTWDVDKSDIIIMCSDGLSNIMSIDEIQEIVNKGLGAKLIVNSASSELKDNERDDISLQIFKINTLSEQSPHKDADLKIPLNLKEFQIIDGMTLIEPLMKHRRIWKVKKDNTFLVMKFPMSDDEQAIDEFVKEAWYAKQIHHRSFGNAWIPAKRTARYYLMELVEGTNLMQYLKNSTLSIDNTVELGKFLHKAQAHLLNLGLVHGDIKPENIIVYKNDEKAGVVFKMVDFGSIVEIFSEKSKAGTPSFLAPERFMDSNINEATEIFSMGVTMYWALTKKYPYGEIEPFQNPKFKEAKRPSTYNKNIPAWLDSIILRAIAIDTEKRHSHYSELFYELKDPQNVKPYFSKDTSFIEKEPLLFYKTGFFVLLLVLFMVLLSGYTN